MRKRRGAPVKHREAWRCETCDVELPGRADLMDHLRGTHHLAPPIKGKSTLVLHLDMAQTYSSTYEWTLDGVRLVQMLSGPR